MDLHRAETYRIVALVAAALASIPVENYRPAAHDVVQRAKTYESYLRGERA